MRELYESSNKQLLIASSRVPITPNWPVRLAASPYRALTEDVAEPLEANILLLRNGDNPFVIITLDLLYPGRRLREAVEVALSGLAADRIFVAASHTHSAPPTYDGKEGLGPRDDDYIDWVVALLVSELGRLTRRAGHEAKWSAAASDLRHSVNRRLKTRRGVRMAPNPGGPTDETATVLLATSASRPIAVLWNYACHPVSHPFPRQLASHYPFVVRSRLRKLLAAPDLPVLFLQGFSGDTRPSATTTIRTAKDLLLRFRVGKGFYDMDERAYEQWSGSLASSVCNLGLSAQSVEVDYVDARRLTVPLSGFVRGGPADAEVAFHRISLGDSVSVVGVSAEVVSDYSTYVRGQSPTGHITMCVGCIDDTYGYLPTSNMLSEGGYEASGFCRPFGYDKVETTCEQIAKDALDRLW